MKTKIKIAVIAMIGLNFVAKAQIDSNNDLQIGYQKKIYSVSTEPYRFEMIPFSIGGSTEFRNYYASGKYKFYVSNGTHGNGNTLGLLINQNGSVGIGTTSPSAKLDVKNGHLYVGDETFSNPGNWGRTINVDDNVHARILIEERQTGVQTALSSHTGGKSSVGSISNHDFSVMTQGSEKMRIKTNGNVGIGTTSPSAKLDVKNGHLYVGDETFSNPGNWGQTINIDDNVHARILIEERQTGVQTALWSHTGGKSSVGTISNHDFSVMTKGSEKMRIMANGNVGIGTTSPSAKLEVKGDFKLGNGGVYNDLIFKTGTAISGTNGVFEITPKTMPGSGTAQQTTYFKNASHSSGKTMHNVVVDGNVGIGTTNPVSTLHVEHNAPVLTFKATNLGSGVRFNAIGQNGDLYRFQKDGITKVIIKNSGSLGIGTSTTGSHKLAVEGSIGAREIKVEASGWSDFVFEKDYNLPTLQEVESHIKEKGHLKDIPSAKEVEKNGFYLGEMDAKLLQKIEELTLYTIEQEKALKNQHNKIEKLEKENKQLKSLLERVAKLEEAIHKK